MAKRIYRSKQEKMIAGVCGGIAEYCDVDPTLVRLIWVALSFFGGGGIIAYFIAMIIIPYNKQIESDQHYDNYNKE